MKYWVGVASKEHVQRGVGGGFCQLCHGKQQPLKRMSKGDWIIYYSSKEIFAEDTPCQKFTAIGQIVGDEPYQFQMERNFVPFRRDVNFKQCKEVAIHPLIEHLSFIKSKKNWGYTFRFGVLEIPQEDFRLLAANMLDRKAYENLTVN